MGQKGLFAFFNAEKRPHAASNTYQNINYFGGDPDRITINGQSAGGASVMLHLLAPGAPGLFHQAIAQSVYRPPLRAPLELRVRVSTSIIYE